MLTLTLLGTGAAVPGPGRDNTSLAIDDGAEITLVDVSGSPVKRLAENGLDPGRLTRLIITHEHLDHTCGLPSLLQSLWLTGRREPLSIYAQAETWVLLDRLVDAFRPGSWTRGFPVNRHVVVPGPSPILETSRVRIASVATRHSVPTFALRIESTTGSAATYSADTSPSEGVVSLARRADLLIHEATFLAGAEAAASQVGHSTAAQAAEIAVRAEVARLVLIHFTPKEPGDLERQAEGAASIYQGPLEVPSDGATITLL